MSAPINALLLAGCLIIVATLVAEHLTSRFCAVPARAICAPPASDACAPPPSSRARRLLSPKSRDPHRSQRRRRRVQIAVLAAVAAVVSHPLLVGAIAAAAWLATAARGIVATKRRQQLIDRELPDALDIFALLLAAGSTPRQAVTELSQRGPLSTRPAFASVVTRLETGAAFADAITELRATLGHRATALVDLLTAAERSGLPMAQVVLQLSSESRATRRRLDEAAARALPIKLSFPLVVCTLPSFVMLAIVPAVVAALSSLGSDAW